MAHLSNDRDPESLVAKTPGAPAVAIPSLDVPSAQPEEPRCDVCDGPVPSDDADLGFSFPGAGVYLCTRGDSVRFETVPLCASCASAIGMTALARWEIEEEEG
jgi:hypothetical protein